MTKKNMMLIALVYWGACLGGCADKSQPANQKSKVNGVYRIWQTEMPIVIDGKADEEAWKKAPMSSSFSDAEGGRKVGADTRARLLWDDQFLYAFVQVSDTDVFSQYHKHDDPLWKEDVVEIFIDADKNRHGYIELQVNPNNTHFDAWFPKTRGPSADFGWASAMQSAVVVHGSKDNRNDKDRGWDVEIAIPLEAVKGKDKGMKVNIPPEIGDVWRLNIVRGEKPKDKGLAASSWNPIPVQDFHALERMLEVAFVNTKGGHTKGTKIPKESAAEIKP